jgi:hypothetical protein
MGCMGQYLDPHARPQIQVEFALKHAKMSPKRPFHHQDGSNARPIMVHV